MARTEDTIDNVPVTSDAIAEGTQALKETTIEQILWEMGRQEARAKWERKNDRNERPNEYRKREGDAVALPTRPSGTKAPKRPKGY